MSVETPTSLVQAFNPSNAPDAPLLEDMNSAQLDAPAIQRMLALGLMSCGIVHDFRNVLAVVSAALHLVERHEGNAALSSEFLATAQEGLERGTKMTTRLLDFVSGHVSEVSANNVNVALQKLEKSLRFVVGDGVKIALRLDPSVWDCAFDPSQFSAAIMNLVVNARDAMPSGGIVRISTCLVFEAASPGEIADHYVRVRIEDNGSGMDAGVKRKIFEPFFTTKSDAGTGLGVPQVYNFVKRAGGFMRVASIIGEGRTFDLLLPCKSVTVKPAMN